MGNPFDVYAVVFGLSVLMLVILFVVPWVTNFGRTEEKEEDDVELLYEDVDDEDEDDKDDLEDLYEDESETKLKKEETKFEGKDVGVKKQETTASKA